MRRIPLWLPALALPCAVLAAQPGTTTSHDKVTCDTFVRSHVERPETPPFAFLYGGRAFSAAPTDWDVKSETRADDVKTLKTLIYADRNSGLRVTATYTIYSDYPVVEWVVRFKNAGMTSDNVFVKCTIHEV